MALDLNEILLWCRSLDEYCRIFSLDDKDLKKKILGCADGAASFNCEASRRGIKVTSVDPIYILSDKQIAKSILRSRDIIYPKIVKNSSDYIWEYFDSPESLREHRMAVMMKFLDDLNQGIQQQRYLYGELPHLNFKKNTFDLALVSCFLFLYSQQLDLNFHIQSINTLCHVAKEVRIFPLQSNLGGKSDCLKYVIEHLGKMGYKSWIEPVDFHFTRGSNEMLKIISI